MKQKLRRWILPILILLLAAGGILVYNQTRYEQIDHWSGSLVLENIDLAEIASGYGVERISYTLTQEDYTVLLPLLQTITEDISSRKQTAKGLEDGSRLVFYYEDTLWLFKCCEGEVVSLTFQDAETGGKYGCEGSLLYFKSPALWHYIRNTVTQKAA